LGNGNPQSKVRWRAEVARASKVEANWRKEAKRVRELYRQERRMETAGGPSASSVRSPDAYAFNILFSNTQTLLPALHGRSPRPDVRPRYQPKPILPPQMPASVPALQQMAAQPPGPLALAPDPQMVAEAQKYAADQQAYLTAKHQDEVTKSAALVLERGLAYSVAEYGFDATIRAVLTDYLLTGRGVPRIRYEPKFRRIDLTAVPGLPVGEGMEPPPPSYLRSDTLEPIAPDAEIMGVEDDEPYIEELEWEKVRCELVAWDAFRVSPAKCWADVKRIYFEHHLTREELVEQFGDAGAAVPLDSDRSDNEDVSGTRSEDSKDNQDSYTRALVWEAWDKDTRKVTFFAPSTKSDEPLKVEDDPLKLDGFFPIPPPLYSIPSTDSMVPLPEYLLYEDQAGELDRLTRRINAMLRAVKYRGIYNGQVSEVANLLKADDLQMVNMENFQVAESGLAKNIFILDVTPVINALKQLYASREQAKLVIYEITALADIMRGNSDPNETLGAQQLKAQWGSLRIQNRRQEVERMVVDLFRMKAEIMAKTFSPETLSAMSGVEVTEEIVAFLRNDAMRKYRIDVETDSMIAADRSRDQEQAVKLLSGFVEFTQGIAPAVQGGAISMEAVKAILLSVTRLFPVMGREVEDALNQMPDKLPPMGMPAPGGGPMAAQPQPVTTQPTPQQSFSPPGMMQ
jgi:hypothetical protein